MWRSRRRTRRNIPVAATSWAGLCENACGWSEAVPAANRAQDIRVAAENASRPARVSEPVWFRISGTRVSSAIFQARGNGFIPSRRLRSGTSYLNFRGRSRETTGGVRRELRRTRLTNGRALSKVYVGRASGPFCCPLVGGRTIGSTSDSGSDYPGSSPGLPANFFPPIAAITAKNRTPVSCHLRCGGVAR